MPKDTELKLISKLATNMERLLTEANSQDWLLLHMAAMLKYLHSYRSKLDASSLTIVRQVFQQLAILQDYLCPPNTTECPKEIRYHILSFYTQALEIATTLQLPQEHKTLCSKRADFLQINELNQQITPKVIIPTDYRELLECLNTYSIELLTAKRNQDQLNITKFSTKLDILETSFLIRMFDPNPKKLPSKLIKNLAYHLYKNQTENPNFSKGLLEIFNFIINKSPIKKQNLELLVFLSAFAFPKDPIDTQYLPDWQRYRDSLQAQRTELAKEISPINALVAQHNFSRNLQNLTRIILQECFDLLGPPTPPHRLCFLMLGSMSRMDMQPYSDFEYALLEDGTNQEYTEKLLSLFEFKIHSLGEHSFSELGEPPSSGFHLDAEAHPGKTSPLMERLRGTPQELIERCLHYWEQPWTDPDNFCHLQISYSLLQADYLWDTCDLWQEYQHQLTSFLTPERRKSLADKYLQFHSAKFMAKKHATTRIKIKALVIAPLIYLLQDIYLQKTITSTCNHSIVNILDSMVIQKIISPDFACDCSRILNLAQFLRYQEQTNLQRQVKPELVAKTEELEGALSLIRATHEVTYILSLTEAPTEPPSITALNIASLPFDPLLLKLHAFEQLQLSNKPDQAPDLCTLHELAIPDELILLLKNRIWTLALHQASILKYKEYYVQLPSKTLREIMLRFIENYESQSRRQIIWETLARYPNCDGTRPFVEREEEQWLEALAHLFATNDHNASSATLTIVYMDKIKAGQLHRNVYNFLVDSKDSKHPTLKTQSCGGTHLVLPVKIGDDNFHFKFYPENPGYEIAAARLHKLVIGHGASQSVLARLELLGNIYPVLISKTVAEQDLSLVLHNEPDTPLTLDAKFYSQLFLLSLLLQPEDGKPDNYILQEITIDGKKHYTLVCIDNDHVFAKPMEEAGWFTMEQIFTKTIIYCLDQLRTQPLHSEAIEEFLLLKPIYLLDSWLKELEKYAKSWLTLFNQTESEIYAKMPKLNQQSLLRLKLPLGLMGLLYQQFCTMQEILTICKEQQTSITPYELLKRKNRKLAKFYKQLFVKFKTPKQRFAEIARLYYKTRTTQKGTREIVRYQSRIDSRQMFTLSFGIRTNLLELIRRGGYTITLSQQELEMIAHRYKIKKEAIAHLESGNKELIQKELNILHKMPKTEIEVFLSRIINQLDFSKIPFQFHITILNLFYNTSIDKLLLRNCNTLTDSLLLAILNKQPNLRMLQLEGCSNLSVIKLPFLPNLMSIRIKGCADLQSIEMLEKGSRKTAARTLVKLTVLEIIDCPKMDILQIPVPTWQLKQQLCFKDHSYYINKYRIMIKKLFVHYSKMYIDTMVLNLYREISTSKAIINYELHKKLQKVIKQYLLVLENNRVILALIKALQDENWEVRRKAAEALGILGNADERFISALITALQNTDEDVRSNAAEALGKLGNADEPVISALITALQDTDKYVRINAAEALAKLGNADEPVISSLIMALQDKDWCVSRYTAVALNKLSNADDRVISALITALQDTDWCVRKYAAKALAKVGNADQRVISALITALQDTDWCVRKYAAKALAKVGNADQRVISALITALQDTDWCVRKYAAKALAKVGNADQRVISALITALQDTDKYVRINAAQALAKMGKADERVISPLITALQDTDKYIRINAAKALAKMGKADEHVISALITALQDTDWCVRRYAAKALGILGNADERVISPLITALQDTDKYIRINAAKALAKVGKADEHVISALITALQDTDWCVRKYAAKTLAKVGKADERIISALITALQDTDWHVNRCAANTLGILGKADEHVISALITAVQDKDWRVNRCAAEALAKVGKADERIISALITAVQDIDWGVNKCAAKALGILGNADERVISPLITALQHTDWYIRSDAADTLGILGKADEHVISALITALQDKDKYVRSDAANTLGILGKAEKRVISALITALQDKDKYVRRYAAEALGILDNAEKRVISALITALQDKDKYVRSNAAQALGEILSPQNGFATQIRQTIAPYIAPEHRPIRFFANTSKIPAITSFIMHNIFTQLNLATLPLKQRHQFFALSRVNKTWYTLFQHPTLIAQREATKKLLAAPIPLTIDRLRILSVEASLPPTSSKIHSGLELQKIKGDGNCLYRAVTMYLSHGEDIAYLREIVAANLEQNPETYRGFITLPTGESLPDYIARIRSTREWAGNVEINILMQLLNRPIVIIGPDGNIRNIDEVNLYSTQEPIFVYYNGEDHYDALILKVGSDGRALLTELCNLAPGCSRAPN